MEFVCDKCAKPTKESDFIKCQGFCEAVAHAKCVGLNNQQVKLKTASENLLWFCDGCLKLLKFARFRQTVAALGNTIAELLKERTAAINELKTEVRKSGAKAVGLPEKLQITPRSVSNDWPIIKRSAPKRRREEHSISNSNATEGTNANLSKLVATVPVEEKKFWIYLSRIHPDVSVENVQHLVSECVQCGEPPEIVKLVKRDVDTRSLRFISFKVGIDPKYKETALSSSTWPAGIFFREFVDYRSKNGYASATPILSTSAEQ
ncbi:uncharacterized protein LOC129719639 [Wyeomyia smithii]|uniref:uncharacterized protein LOC129719639 n=1 Tax=Wyeomyia smithii TaxID=174621 RepID=UPI0024681BC3|nr:uncharacterized protein LOC129719639 [Wyeomyia smithii]